MLTWLKLAWKNTISNPLGLLLNLLLFALSVGLLYFLLVINDQLKQKFENNLAEIDLVIGAKGSALQMILCNMYHVDAPTGNIKISDVKPFLNPNYPLIKESVPLSLGDNYQGYRIVGTETSILNFYQAKVGKGNVWTNANQAVIGANVHKKLGLNIGDTFKSSHGFNQEDDLEHDHGSIQVVGILEDAGSVIDQLILTDTKTVWEVHNHQESEEDHSGHDHSGHDHSGHDHAGHDHHHKKPPSPSLSRADLIESEDQEITSLLVRYKNKKSFQSLSLPRNINANTNLQAVSPAITINMLYDRMGIGTRALQLLAILIAVVSALSIFISLFNALRARKYELAILRVNGAKPSGIFSLICFEGLIISFLGFLVGILISYIVLFSFADQLSEKYNYPFDMFMIHPSIYWLFIGSITIGLIAALLPAIKAYRINIHDILSKSQ